MKDLDYGTVNYNGKELKITQAPYPSDWIGEEDYYTSYIEDDEGNGYKVLWPITRPDCEDQSEACDWEDYKILKY